MSASSLSLLLVDDDPTFSAVLSRALTRRGYVVTVAHDVAGAIEAVAGACPTHAVVDLRMPGASGLVLVEHLRKLSARMRIVVLTGYASIPTAVEAIKRGATHYLAKPADADQIVAAFGESPAEGDNDIDDPNDFRPLSVRRLEWEHIQRVLAEQGGNVSATARALGMHRRTLQRKLGKKAPKG
ncbi:MAG: response regulator transcription factor [Burkholderiales bacterium]